MGVTGLNKYLSEHFVDIYQKVHLSHFSYKRVIFDISSYIYRYIAKYGKDTNGWLAAFVRLLCLFKQHSVHLIPVFDGVSPAEKQEEKQKRGIQRDNADVKCLTLSLDLNRYKTSGEKSENLIKTMRQIIIKRHNDETRSKIKRLLRPSKNEVVEETEDDVIIDVEAIEQLLEGKEKNNFEITQTDLELLRTLLTKLKIPFLLAPGEAESLCCYLSKEKKVDAVFSMDSDCLAHGATVIINDLDMYSATCKIIVMENMCEQLGLNPSQITDWCIICGVDYNRHTKSIKGIGPAKAYALIKKWTNYAGVKEHEKIFQIEDDGLRYARSIELFNMKYPEFDKVSLLWDVSIDIKQLSIFLAENKIYANLDQIEKLWKPSAVVFIDE